jgi:putative spermidine/putrescine transport system ATP-binding protein/putrescine transport system ATP-binding protein
LGRALANRPQLILLDEPLSALDAKLRLEMRGELKRIIEVSGATALIVTHDQEEAMSLAERVVIMSKGKIEQEGTPSHIYHYPDTVFVAEFVGRSNWLVGTPCEKTGECVEMKIVGGRKLLVKAPKGARAAKYNICIRPEALFFLEDDAEQNAAGNESRGAVNRLHGTIVDSTYLGNSWDIVVDIGENQKLTVMLNSASLITYTAGRTVILGVFPENVILIEST